MQNSNTSLGSVSEKLIENTDANITIDNPFISYQNSYGENSYKYDLLYSISDSVNVKVSNCKLYLRAQGNKLLHKSQDLCPISINRFENIDFTTVNPNATTLFGSVRIRGSQGIDSVDSTSGLYLEVKKTESSTSSNIIFEPNCDLLPISSLKNIVALPSISLDECNVSTVGVHYLIRYFTKERKLSSTSSSFINFNYTDGLTAPKTLKDLTGFGFCVPYAVNNYRFYIPEDVPSDAAFFIPTIRLQFTGEGSSIFKFQSFNMIDRMDISKFTFQKYIQDLPTQGASIKGDLLFYKDKYVVYDGVRWVDNAGYSASANKYGTTDQRPVLTSSDTGFIYYDTSLLKLIVWTGNVWRESDGVIAGTIRNGTTAQRPTVALNSIYAGFWYRDSTISQPIVHICSDVWMDANGNSLSYAKIGTTAQRPSNHKVGYQYIDTTINKVIYYIGDSKWVDNNNTEV